MTRGVLTALLFGGLLAAMPASACPDADSDGICDVDDNCPFYATLDVADTNGDGIGDACQCGDANNDGSINLLDVFWVQDIIFAVVPYNDLADTNNDGLANLDDIFGVVDAVFQVAGPICNRYPVHPSFP